MRSPLISLDLMKPSSSISIPRTRASFSCPLLGIFGNEDKSPSPEQVNQHEEELKKYGKDYKFYRYDGAGHGFWYYHTTNYRPVQAMDAWNKVFEFFAKHLQS